MEHESKQRRNRLTPEAYAELKKRLDDLVNVRRKQVADYIRAAEEDGISAEAMYEEAFNEQALIEKQITELESLLAEFEE